MTAIISISIFCITFLIFVWLITYSINVQCKKGNHKFEPRYNKIKIPGDFQLSQHPLVSFTAKDLEKILFERYYIYDICVKCGERTREE